MRLTPIDFIATPARSSQLGIVLIVVGSLLAGLAVMDDSRRSEELVQSQKLLKKARLAQKRAEQVQTATPGSALAEFKQSGEMAQRLGFGWGGLLDALEQAQNGSVALLSIEPDAAQGRLRLSGEAKNLDLLVDYVKAIDGQAGISGMRLLTQQIKQSDPQHPVEFVLESRWLAKPPLAPHPGASS